MRSDLVLNPWLHPTTCTSSNQSTSGSVEPSRETIACTRVTQKGIRRAVAIIANAFAG